jgi:hypothetical protein
MSVAIYVLLLTWFQTNLEKMSLFFNFILESGEDQRMATFVLVILTSVLGDGCILMCICPDDYQLAATSIQPGALPFIQISLLINYHGTHWSFTGKGSISLLPLFDLL